MAMPCFTCQKPITFSDNPDPETGKKIVLNEDGTRHTHPKPAFGAGGGGYRGKSEAEMHDIRREAVLNAAVAYSAARMTAGDGVEPQDVINTANLFLRWVETDRPKAFAPASTATAPMSPPRPVQPTSSGTPAALSSGSGRPVPPPCDVCGANPVPGGGKFAGRVLCKVHYTQAKLDANAAAKASLIDAA